MQNNIENNIKKIYLYEILNGMLFYVPILVLFLQENGLSITEIMILQSIYAILIVILEIPTGYFSDIFGRKISLIIGAINMLFAFLIYSIGTHFLHFLLAEIFFAIAISFQSGTVSAFTYDTLLNINREKEYKKIWGNILFYGMISLAVSSIIGGFIAKIDLRYVMYASIPFFILLIILSLSFKEPEKQKEIIIKGYKEKLINNLVIIFKEKKRLKWLIIYSGIIIAFNQSAFWLYQPYLSLSGIDIVYFGIIFAGFNLVSAISSKFAHKIENFLGERYSLIMLIFLVSISYFLMSNFIFLFSFSFCFIQQFVKGFKDVIITDYINKLSESNLRATILSIDNSFSNLLYALIIPFIGWITDIYSLVQALNILAFMSLTFGVILLIFLKKTKTI